MLVQSAINYKLEEMRKQTGSINFNSQLTNETFNKQSMPCFGFNQGIGILEFAKGFLKYQQPGEIIEPDFF